MKDSVARRSDKEQATMSKGSQIGTGGTPTRALPEVDGERHPAADQPEPVFPLAGRALVAMAMVIPLVMMTMVVVTRIQYDRLRRREFISMQALAQSRYDMAQRVEGAGAQSQAYSDALLSVGEALAMNPTDETLLSLQRRISTKLDELDNVVRLYHFWQLVQFEEDPGSESDSARIVVEGQQIYLLNRGSDRVYSLMLNEVGDAVTPSEGDPVLIRRGDALPGITVGEIVDIAWIEAGGHRSQSTFVVLERGGSLLAYDPLFGMDVLPVANSDMWLQPEAIGGYYGNLYVLDPLLSRVFKFEPLDNAYTLPPTDYLSPQLGVDLTGAVDMAIDGNLYVLFADGQVLKYFGGQAQPFPLNGLSSPLRSPTSIFVSGLKHPDGDGYVYITDAGNDRIVQFDKAGNYIRQFQAGAGQPGLGEVRGLWVDEGTDRMLLMSGSTLWMTNLPPLY